MSMSMHMDNMTTKTYMNMYTPKNMHVHLHMLDMDMDMCMSMDMCAESFDVC